MSVINNYCDEVSWGEIFPGYSLVQGVNNRYTDHFYSAENGVRMLDGRFGLTEVNDPFVIFTELPVVDPLFGIIDPEKIGSGIAEHGAARLTEITQLSHRFQAEMHGDIDTMGMLYESLRRTGYRPKIHGSAGLYVMHSLALYIEKNQAKPKEVYRRVGGNPDDAPVSFVRKEEAPSEPNPA